MKRISFLYVDLDRCVGCYACEVACRQEHEVPLNEWWIKVFTTEPQMIDDKLLMYFIPMTSDKCTICKNLVDKDISPVCVTSCPTKALRYSEGESLIKTIHEKKPISILKVGNQQ